jgi:polysaccharide export outer membrane protein
MDASDPASNIVICPQDVITIPRAEMVYVVGAVPHGGGFVLQARQSLSALQAYTLAGGADKAASIRKARILRPAAGGSRTEIAVDLSKILAGKSPDVPLKAEDILFIPSSNSRKALARAEDVATLVATGLIYRLP